MERKINKSKLATQIQQTINMPVKKKREYDGDMGRVISTGSTLLDLAISGGRIRGGGLPLGILVEIFGPSGCGKTVLLSEIAGAVQRSGGDLTFFDPEARLNQQFARIFGLDTTKLDYKQPSTVTELFQAVRAWEPRSKKDINGIFADSLAALSTDLEIDNKDGDKMGMRRAKEFSEELRKTCRVLANEGYLMVCSNQVRVNVDAGIYGQKYTTPGGESIGFYSSLRLQARKPSEIKVKEKVAGKEISRTIGVQSEIRVFKSSIWKPYRTASISILFDYGIDDIRENLQFIKDYTKNTMYTLGGEKLAVSLDNSIRMVEERNAEKELKEEVIDLWEMIESKFEVDRKPKQR